MEEVRDYEQVKGEILARCGCSPVNAAGDFHRWRYDPGVNLQAQMDDLLRSCCGWLQPDQLSAQEVMEWVAMDWFLQALPAEERKAITVTPPPQEFLERLKCAVATR
ncbi:hypothetical protein QTP70_001008 [Hemibagrus guttatus]|uniref:SCAN box domain-containing protein n=1 Tax=Hemibagrus guttatus TaxID=175788 RepID=A0AAE0R9C7_9TELE|nr:hypothetical protein QTP70_001008 [Hemibagrus guttatus]